MHEIVYRVFETDGREVIGSFPYAFPKDRVGIRKRVIDSFINKYPGTNPEALLLQVHIT